MRRFTTTAHEQLTLAVGIEKFGRLSLLHSGAFVRGQGISPVLFVLSLSYPDALIDAAGACQTQRRVGKQ